MNTPYFTNENEVKDRDSLIVFLTTGYDYDKQDKPEVQIVLKSLENKVANDDFDILFPAIRYKKPRRELILL